MAQVNAGKQTLENARQEEVDRVLEESSLEITPSDIETIQPKEESGTFAEPQTPASFSPEAAETNEPSVSSIVDSALTGSTVGSNVASRGAESMTAQGSTQGAAIASDELTPSLMPSRLTSAVQLGNGQAVRFSMPAAADNSLDEAIESEVPEAAGIGYQQGPLTEEQEEQVADGGQALPQAALRYIEDRGRNIVMQASFDKGTKDQKKYSPSPLLRRFSKAKEAVEKKIKKVKLRGKTYSGNNFFETIFSLNTIMPDCVSIGSENLKDALRDPNGVSLVDQINNYSGLIYTVDDYLADIDKLIYAINSCNIPVILEKGPVNINNSIQVRTLRAHKGRGIGLHPTQTKAYNADFDGDDAVIHLNGNTKGYSRAMARLIDIEGNPTIDPDFFPLDEIAESQTKDVLAELRDKYFSWDPALVDSLFGAYKKACNEKDWVSFLRRIDEVANGDYRLAARILKSFYDFSTMRRGFTLKVQWENVVDEFAFVDTDLVLEPVTEFLLDIYNDIVAGRPVPSFEAFTAMYNKQFGDFNNKNIPFRLLADFAKIIKRTDLVSVGSAVTGIKEDGSEQQVSLFDVWDKTCAAGVAKVISGRMHLGSHELAVSTQMRDRVIKETQAKYGSPIPVWDLSLPAEELNKQFREWIDFFMFSYNANRRMLSAAQIQFANGMKVDRKESLGHSKNDGIYSVADVAKYLLDVYGDYSVSRIFPKVVNDHGTANKWKRHNSGSAIISKYKNMSLSEFSKNNRIYFVEEFYGKDASGKDVKKSKKQGILDRVKQKEYTPSDIMFLVVDEGTQEFGTYGKEWLTVTNEHMNILHKISQHLADHDYGEYLNDMLDLVHIASPKMFDFFGMESPIAFVKSKWGKKLMSAATLENFRSTWFSMIVEYKMSRPAQILRSMNDVKKAGKANSREKIAELDAVFEQEMMMLRSSSLVWETIVDESFDGDRVFKHLLKTNGKAKDQKDQPIQTEAQDFWKATNVEDEYSLVNFLKSGADFSTKIAVLCDVVRVRSGIRTFSKDHVIGMLAHDPNPLMAGSRYVSNDGFHSQYDALKESIDRISGFKSKLPSTIEKEAYDLLSLAANQPDNFEETLKAFSEKPYMHVYVDPVFAADALATVYDKDYGNSEKNQQQKAVNGYFEAVSLQHTGGFYTHLQQVDNRTLNVVGYNQLSAFDIVQILGNPLIELHGYDEFGQPCVYSRESLCGGNTIDDVIKYLQEHPKIALACRVHVAGVNNDRDGTSRLVALNSTESLNRSASYEVFSLLNDRYRFLSIVNLLTPGTGNVGRNMSTLLNSNINNLCGFVYKMAASGQSAPAIIKAIEEELGVSPENIVNARQTDSFDSFTDNLPDPLMDIDAAMLCADVVDELLDCVYLVRENIDSFYDKTQPEYDSSSFSIDKISLISYYDAKQQLGGARTQKMIGIEGSETWKNLLLKEYVKSRQDRFMTVTSGMPHKALVALGKKLDRDLLSELRDLPMGKKFIVVERPSDWNIDDLSLEHSPAKQTSSIAKFLEVKREKGAETFNMKVKKFGDDLTNSIIKFFKYCTSDMANMYNKRGEYTVEDAEALRDQILSCQTKDEAIPILAQALAEADNRLGYIDMTGEYQLSDYYNLADLMLAQPEENGPIYIRTLEQLSTGLRSQLADEFIEDLARSEIDFELQRLVDIIGTPLNVIPGETDVASRTLQSVRTAGGTSRVRFDRAMREASSSVERNYSLLFKIFNMFANTEHGEATYNLPGRSEMFRKVDERNGSPVFQYKMPSRKEINLVSAKMLKKLPYELQKAIKGIAYPYDTFNYKTGKYELNVFGDRQYLYDYLGRPSDEGFMLIPGPQSLVLFDSFDPKTLDKCRQYGITAAFLSLDDIPSEYREDAQVLSDDIIILPFFDMKLNGMMTSPLSGAPAQWVASPDSLTVSDEDTTYELRGGDASGGATQEGLDSIHFNQNGVESFPIRDLFPNEIVDVDEVYSLEPATKEEVARWIDPDNPEATVDLGVVKGTPSYERELALFNIRFNEYLNKQTDSNSMVIGDCRYDSIVGFVKLRIGRGDNFVFAPIIPFNLEQSGVFPSSFKIDNNYGIDGETNSFYMSWSFTGDVRNQYIKFFEGIGASNKLMIFGDPIRSRKLANGMPVHIMYAKNTVASRLFPSNKRIHTMISMIMISRTDPKYKYNFGLLDGAFPGREDIAQKVIEGSMTIEDWSSLMKDEPNFVFHNDSEINSVAKWFVTKCLDFGTVNPNIFLGTKFGSVDADSGQFIERPMNPRFTEFEAFLDSGYNFQNAFMKFMNSMNKTLCPESIDGDSSKTLFKPVGKNRNDETYGTLQMMVPHWLDDGTPYKVPENVYISFAFYSDVFSGFKRANYWAKDTTTDNINVSALPTDFELSQALALGRSDYHNVGNFGGIELELDTIGDRLKEERKNFKEETKTAEG